MSSKKKRKTKPRNGNEPENRETTACVPVTVLEVPEDQKLRVRRWVERLKDPAIRIEEKDGKFRVVGIEPAPLWWHVELFETLGVADRHLQFLFSRQAAMNFTKVDLPAKTPEEQWTLAQNTGMALLREIGPRDPIEGMLIVDMQAARNIAQWTMRQATSPNLPVEVRKTYLDCAAKMLRIVPAQVEAFKKYRGGGQQKVTVEHVHVHQGGQAVVGHIEAGPARNSAVSEGRE
jgi:hypothetical protein